MKNVVRQQQLLALVPFFLIFTVVLAPTADAQTLHALLVIMDDDPTIGNTVVIDQKRIENLLIHIKNKRVCSVKTVVLLRSEGVATTDQMKKWLQNIRPGSNDIVFVYYSGHGAMAENGETFIVTQGGVFYRKDLVKAMGRVRNCRLKILITDACNSSVREPTAEPPGLSTTLGSALKDLFLEHKGFLHLTAATEGEYAWGDSRRGGWFTSPLVATILESPDPNRDGFVSWEEVFEEAKKRTMALFAASEPYFSPELKAKLKRRGITSQRPKYYSLPTKE